MPCRLSHINCFFDEAAQGQPMRAKRIKSLQTKLLESVSSDIQAAFDELRK